MTNSEKPRPDAVRTASNYPGAYTLTIDIHTVCKVFLYLLSIIAVLHSLGQISRFLYGHDYIFGFVPLFYMYSEQNVPTWFSSLLLIICSGLLYVIASEKRRSLDRTHGYWLLLCLIFLFLSVDETATIHEKVGSLSNRLLHHALPNAWMVPYAVLAGVLGAVLAKFFLSLSRKYQVLFCLSGMLYVGGALGMEILEVIHVLGGGANDPIFVVLVTIEEVMEAGSIILFVYSLLTYMKEHIRTLHIRVQ